MLGIDEHSFNRKIGYATTFCDLRTHKVFDVVPGRFEVQLAHYLDSLIGKDRVKVVCIDLSSTYRNLIKKHFPNAMIVADRFHVIRLMQHHCIAVYREINPDIKNNRGTLAVQGNTFYQWREEIGRMWRFIKSNGIAEGFSTVK